MGSPRVTVRDRGTSILARGALWGGRVPPRADVSAARAARDGALSSREGARRGVPSPRARVLRRTASSLRRGRASWVSALWRLLARLRPPSMPSVRARSPRAVLVQKSRAVSELRGTTDGGASGAPGRDRRDTMHLLDRQRFWSYFRSFVAACPGLPLRVHAERTMAGLGELARVPLRSTGLVVRRRHATLATPGCFSLRFSWVDRGAWPLPVVPSDAPP